MKVLRLLSANPVKISRSQSAVGLLITHSATTYAATGSCFLILCHCAYGDGTGFVFFIQVSPLIYLSSIGWLV